MGVQRDRGVRHGARGPGSWEGLRGGGGGSDIRRRVLSSRSTRSETDEPVWRALGAFASQLQFPAPEFTGAFSQRVMGVSVRSIGRCVCASNLEDESRSSPLLARRVMSAWAASLRALRSPSALPAPTWPLPVSEQAAAASNVVAGTPANVAAVPPASIPCKKPRLPGGAPRRSFQCARKDAEVEKALEFKEAWLHERGSLYGWKMAFVTQVLRPPPAARAREVVRIGNLVNKRGSRLPSAAAGKAGKRRKVGPVGRPRKGEPIGAELWNVFVQGLDRFCSERRVSCVRGGGGFGSCFATVCARE